MVSSEWRRRVQPDYVSDARINELIGLCKGFLADGVIDQGEVEFLGQWLAENRHLVGTWPCNVLYPRIAEVMADGIVDADEQRDLLELLTDFTNVTGTSNESTRLPLCAPPPPIEFEARVFVVTGTFELGTRSVVKQAIESRGGKVRGSFSNKTDFLVIGNLCTPAWIHANYGRKIEAAATAKQMGHAVGIVSESHFRAHL